MISLTSALLGARQAASGAEMKGMGFRGVALAWRDSAFRRLGGAVARDHDARAEEAQPPVAVAAHLRRGRQREADLRPLGSRRGAGAADPDPDRIIVDFPEVNFQIDPSVGRVAAPRAGALVKAFRFGLFGPGKSRVVIELARPACPVKVTTKPIAKGAAPSRLTVRAQTLRRGSFVAAARAANPPPAPSPPEADRTRPPPGRR